MVFLNVDSEELNYRLLLQLVDSRPLLHLVPIWTLRSYLEDIKCCNLHLQTCISYCLLYLKTHSEVLNFVTGMLGEKNRSSPVKYSYKFFTQISSDNH